MKVAIGSDHGGYTIKELLKRELSKEGIEFTDFGTFSTESCDYPDYAFKVAEAVARGEFERGILICGTGIGMSIAANKVKGVRAALCHDVFSAEATRLHNDSNVLTMGERVVGPGLALKIARTWLNTEFSGEERHRRRIDKITDYE
ncbi:MAG: ribose 5-phosphate isomerase B [Firmicutes bacterium]|nr:ribose 5-phosphate isomerase B [Bacillota bacterium]